MKRIPLRLLVCVLAVTSMLPRSGQAEIAIVKLETVEAAGSGLSRVFFGHVVARETVDLAFQVAGQIVTFPMEEGAIVAAGELVAKLDPEPFELALREARARHEQAVRTLERYRQLQGSAVTKTTVLDAETEVELTSIALRDAERALENATLYSPFDALVASRLLPNYSTTAAGTPVVRLHDMSDLRIEIDVPETLFQQAGQNPDVEIVAEFPSASTVYSLEVREFNAETASVGQTYSITLGMTPPDDLSVMPGSSAKVTTTLLSGDTRIEIPAAAIVTGNDGAAYVMVFTPTGADQGRVTRTPVEITASERGTIEIVSGLEAGQEYVAVGASALTDGAEVRRFSGFGN